MSVPPNELDTSEASTASVVDESTEETRVQQRIKYSPLANLIAKHLMKKNIKIVDGQIVANVILEKD